MKTDCLNCGFQNPKNGMKTCSRKCADEFKKKNSREIRNCLFCDSQFEVRKKDVKKICSDDCRKYWNLIPDNQEARINASKTAVKDKFGVDNIFQLDSTKEKIKKTKFERYGDEYYNNPEKNKLTTFENYGVYYASQSDIVKKKVKKTIRERFGVEHHLQLPEIQQKQKNTNLSRHGVESVSQKEEFKQKRIDVTLEKYGVENISQNEDIKQKKKDTSMKNFGVTHHLKDGEMFIKHLKAQYKMEIYNNTDICYQGSYEKYFLELMEDKGFLPEITNGDSFTYINRDIEHVYHVDFKFRDKQIEIKSGWTYNKNGTDKELQDLNDAKWKSVLNSGSDFLALVDKTEIKKFVESI